MVYNPAMHRFVRRLGVVPVLALSAGLMLLGALAVDRIVNTMWPFDVTRIERCGPRRNSASMRPCCWRRPTATSYRLLASVIVALPGWPALAYYLNKRLMPPRPSDRPPSWPSFAWHMGRAVGGVLLVATDERTLGVPWRRWARRW
jgi:hypothetical protein